MDRISTLTQSSKTYSMYVHDSSSGQESNHSSLSDPRMKTKCLFYLTEAKLSYCLTVTQSRDKNMTLFIQASHESVLSPALNIAPRRRDKESPVDHCIDSEMGDRCLLSAPSQCWKIPRTEEKRKTGGKQVNCR